VGLVLVELAHEDVVSAQKAFREGKSYIEDAEISYLTTLLDGFDQMDATAIVTGLNSPFIKSLDNEYTKIARNLQQKYAAKLNANESSNPSGGAVDEEAGAMLWMTHYYRIYNLVYYMKFIIIINRLYCKYELYFNQFIPL